MLCFVEVNLTNLHVFFECFCINIPHSKYSATKNCDVCKNFLLLVLLNLQFLYFIDSFNKQKSKKTKMKWIKKSYIMTFIQSKRRKNQIKRKEKRKKKHFAHLHNQLFLSGSIKMKVFFFFLTFTCQIIFYCPHYVFLKVLEWIVCVCAYIAHAHVLVLILCSMLNLNE